MENREPKMPSQNDYFAQILLDKLNDTEPVYAAYEAQDESMKVGFDFADFQAVVPRALDELRETKEAWEAGEDDYEHFGDEIADIMFSYINLARHAGLSDLPPLDNSELKPDGQDTEELLDRMQTGIESVASVARDNPDDLQEAMREEYASGMRTAVTLAQLHNFDPQKLLTENVRKYLVRCEAIEQLAAEDGKQWADLAREGLIVTYWKKAKVLLN